MAERRMYSKKVTDSDDFITLSSAAQALYFHLNQGADDDGFNNQVQIAMMKAHAGTGDLLMLFQQNFIIRFENGIIVIKHWRLHNTLRKDRYTHTNYVEEMKCLKIKDNGEYDIDLNESRLPVGCQTVTSGKVSIGKDSIGSIINNTSCAEPKQVLPLTPDEPPFISLPLNDKTEYYIYPKLVKEYKELYPAVDVEQQIRAIKGWLISNPKKRKTKSGVLRFVNSWLKKEQDKSGSHFSSAPSDNLGKWGNV